MQLHLGLCLGNPSPGSTGCVRSVTKITGDVPQDRELGGCGAYGWSRGIRTAWSAVGEVCSRFGTDGEKKPPDQVLGHDVLYASVN